MQAIRVPKSVLAGLAGAAVLVAHALAYMVVTPDPHERAHLLAATGHNVWVVIAAACLSAGVFALIGHLRRRLDLRGGPEPLLRSVMARLMTFQVVSFLILEVTERALSGHEVLTTLTEPVVVIGVGLQLLVAFFSSFLVAGVATLIHRLRSRRVRPRRSFVPSITPTVSIFRLAPVLGAGTWTLRGPPVL